MRWELSDEQLMFRDAFRGWLDRVAPPSEIRAWLDGAGAAGFERSLAGEGWLSVGTPEAAGGQGGGLLELAIAAEELGRHAAPSSLWMASVLAGPSLSGRSDLTESLLAGHGVALVIPADDPPGVPGVPGVTVDDRRLRGGVANAFGVDRVRHFLVPVVSDPGAWYLVDANGDGVSVTPRPLLDRSRSAGDVVLDGAPATRVEADVHRMLADAACRAAVLASADALGAMDRMLELAVDYSKQREQFGVPIGSFQAVKHAAATMLVAVESARSIVYYAAASVEQGHPECAVHAAVAKAQVTKAGVTVADLALTVHGAIGYTWEYDLQLFYKRAKLDEYLFGSPSTWNERIATALDLAGGG